MTQAGGLAVDCAALEAAAQKAYEIAEETAGVLSQVRAAINDTVAGAPGSQSAEVAQRAAEACEGWFTRQVETVRGIAEKLEQTANDYRSTDEGVGNRFDGVVRDGPASVGVPGAPGGGYAGPHMDVPELGR